MSIIRAIKHRLGLSVTPANNFVLDASADNGTMKLARESGQDIMTVRANGEAVFYQPFGYALGGGYILQTGDKTQPVTLNQRSGVIGLALSSLAAGQIVRFTLNNALISTEDILLVQRSAGGLGSSYCFWTDFCVVGSAGICVQNVTAGALNEQPNINFALIKGAGA